MSIRLPASVLLGPSGPRRVRSLLALGVIALLASSLLPAAAVAPLVDLLADAPPGVVTRQVGALELLVERIEPPPHLFIFGGGADAVPLAVTVHPSALG